MKLTDRTLPMGATALVLALVLAGSAPSHAATAIRFAGMIEDDSGTEISQWKTAATAKSLDADGDNIYGTLAHLFYRIEFKGQNTLYTFDGSDGQVGPFDGYAVVDHPDGISADTPVRTTTNNAAGDANRVMFTFTALDGSPPNVRIGIATDGLDGPQFAPASIGLRQVDGISTERALGTSNASLDMVFFDVAGVEVGDQFQVFADSGSGGFATHQIVTWDALDDFDLTDPTDGDGDEIGDNWERFFFGDTDAIDGTADGEPDGLTDLMEWQQLTNPAESDTDGDGLPDGEEFAADTDPLDPNDPGPPAPPENLWSVDFQAIPGIFPSLPVLQEGSEANSGINSGVWNAFEIVGHDSTATDPSMVLADAFGNATPVTIAIFGTISGWSNAPNSDALTNDYFFINAGNADPSATWEISGLAPLANYRFYPYGGIMRDMTMTVDTNGDGSVVDETPAIVPGAGMAFAVVSSAAGTIAGTFEPGTLAEANWSGFQLLLIGTNAVDTDLDGLSDDEESTVGTDRFKFDTDGDGQGDGAEFLAAGTDPLDPTSVFKTGAVTYPGSGGVSLTWSSVPGRTYEVDASGDLTTWFMIGSPIDASPAPGTETTATIDTPAAGTLFRFYRIRVAAP